MLNKLNIKRITSLVITLVVVLNPIRIEFAYAGVLTSVSDTLASYKAGTTTTHSISLTTATTSDIKEVHIQFSTTLGGSIKPTGLILTNATLNSVNLFNNGGWSLDTSSASSGLLKIVRSSAINVTSGTSTTTGIQNIVNSNIDDCQPSNDVLQDTCHVRIVTFSDAGTTLVDSGTTTYTVTEDPSLSFLVNGISSGVTHNGITTSVSSTGTTFSFGNMKVGTTKYAAQKISVTTNAPHGYVVYARLENNMKGTYSGTEISPFGATNATWTTPQTWSSPDGDSSNNNTGWFGANTTDTSVGGWESSTSGKFGPISTTDHIVSISSGPQRTGKDAYVSYALEINAAQPSDNYSGVIIYNVQASY